MSTNIASNRLVLILAIITLFVMGLVMIFNTTSAEVLDHNLSKSTHQALFRQMGYAVLGCGLALLARWQGAQTLLKYSPQLLFIFTCLLVLTLVPGIGREVNGSRRWIGLGGYSFQPSEFVKYLIPAYFIYRYMNFGPGKMELRDLIKMLIPLGIPMVLILIEPNNGTVGVIGLTLLMLFILMQVPARFWAMPLLVVSLVGGATALSFPYVQARLKSYLHPELDLKGKGHQPHQAKIAAGSGRMLGKGPGNSVQKLSYLPEAQNDYIAAIYAEEFGFLGMMLLVALYMLIVYLGFSITTSYTDKGTFYFASVVTFLIGFQAFMNLGVVSGLLPSTGLNLPLFSQGGSSLMAHMMALGFLFSK